MVEKASHRHTMKCSLPYIPGPATQEAKAQRRRVEIVEEHQLDTLRCSTTDTDCLTRAKAQGRRSDIIMKNGEVPAP